MINIAAEGTIPQTAKPKELTLADEVYTVYGLAKTLERVVFGKLPKESGEKTQSANRFISLRDQLSEARNILRDVLGAIEKGAGLTEKDTIPTVKGE